jgi:TP901 family phage tail tape measure protein
VVNRTVRVTLEAAVTRFRNDFRAAARDVRQAGGDMLRVAEQNRASFTALGLAMGAAGGAIMLGMRRAGRENIAFNATLTRSTTLIGVARDEMQAMGDAALRMAHTGQGPIELAEALFFVQSAGLRGQAALDVLESSAKAASIGLGETKVVADLVTSAVNAYGIANLSAADAADILIGTVREGKAEAPELAGALGRVLPIASEMGVAFDQVGAAVAAMTRTGTDAATATTQLRAILVSLLNPAQQSEQAMADLGLSSAALRRTIREDGLWQAMMDLRDAAGDNEAALGQLFPNVRALAGFLDLTGANAAENAIVFAHMADTVGLLDEGFEEWSRTGEAAIARFSAASQSARIALLEGVEGPMVRVLDAGTRLAEMFVDLPRPVRGTIGVLTGATGAALLFGGALLIGITRVNQLRVAMALAGAQAVTFRGALASTGRLLMGPFGLAFAAATLAVTAFVQIQAELKRRADEVTETLDRQTGAVTRATEQWAAHELATRRLPGNNREISDSLRTVGLEMDDLVGAILGQEDAVRRTNAALSGHDGFWRSLSSRWDDSAGSASHLRRVIDEMGGDVQRGRDQFELMDAVLRELNPELAEIADRFDLVGDSSVDAAEDMLKAWSEAAADFASLQGAYVAALGEVEDAERERAEEAAIAAGRSADAWAEFVGSAEASIDDYIDQLKRMVADQAAWADNLVALSGRVPDAMLDHLARLGPEGAGLVGMLTRAGNAELAEIGRLWPHTTEQGMRAVTDAIAEAGPQLRAIAEQHGEDVARAVRDEMIANGHTVEEAAKNLGLRFVEFIGPVLEGVPPIRVVADDRALREAERQISYVSRGRTVTLSVSASGDISLPGVPRHATGGMLGGVGGPTEDRNLFLGSPGEFVIRAAAVDHYGPGFMEALNSMRIPALAGGGPLTSVRVPVMAMGNAAPRGGDGATAGGHFTGNLFLSSGEFLGVVDGRIASAQAAHDRDLEFAITQGTGAAR